MDKRSHPQMATSLSLRTHSEETNRFQGRNLAHRAFRCSLGLKSRVPQAPLAALLSGALLADVAWIAFGLAGVENAATPYFDDWSHSLAMTVLWASLFAPLFWRSGFAACVTIWVAGVAHFLLDLIHPEPMALYPRAALHSGWSYWGMGLISYWIVELIVVLLLMAVYVWYAHRRGVPKKSIFVTSCIITAIHALRLALFVGAPSLP